MLDEVILESRKDEFSDEVNLDISQGLINFMISKSYFQLVILKTLKNRFKNK